MKREVLRFVLVALVVVLYFLVVLPRQEYQVDQDVLHDLLKLPACNYLAA